MALKIFIHGLGGNCWVLDGQQGWCGADAKKVLEEMSGVPRRDQRLIMGTQELKETDSLGVLSDGPEMQLTLLVRNPEFAEWLERISNSEFPQDVFRCAPEHVCDDREIVLAVVSKHGFSLKFASEDMQANRDVVLTAVRQTGAALAYAAVALRADKELVLAAVIRHGAALEHASEELQRDREVVLAAVSNQARALRFASKDLRADPEVVSVAAHKDASALAFAASEVLDNKEVLEPVVKRFPSALRYAGAELRGDWSLLLNVPGSSTKWLRDPACALCSTMSASPHGTAWF
ncbi:unnamed protein product [Effrenium voratum]|nr:unnamed protein product [Effrenium voratum]|mmetsp:Transcript_116648/g.277289  ORF Transcript_116648/g.277289 Transcript_116648/m.277289 type:complete len:292 (+) Transcript_116648:97-972(+)